MKQYKAVLFDLDGTLLDTAGDLGHALNTVLQSEGLPALPLDIIRPAAGRGSEGLLKLGLNIDKSDPHFSRLSQQLLAVYQTSLCATTRLFTGMEEVLAFLEKNHLPWGIVTNKPAQYTDPLLAYLNLSTRAKCVISGDTLTNRKPHPEPILHACRLLQQAPEDCLYIGDSEIDIQASKAANVASLAALYGYIPEEINPRDWNADGYIQQPVDIIKWLDKVDASNKL